MADFYLSPDQDEYLRESVIRNMGKYIRALGKDKKWKISIGVHVNKRTLEQQAYYWSVVLPTIKAWHHETTGNAVSEEVVHEELKPVYVPYKAEIGMDGEEVKLYRSTTKITTVQYNDMFDRIVSDFAELGCHIPPPDKNWKSNKRKAA